MTPALRPILAMAVGVLGGAVVAWALHVPVLDHAAFVAATGGAVCGALAVAATSERRRLPRAALGALAGSVAALVGTGVSFGWLALAAIDAGVGPPLALAVIDRPVATGLAWLFVDGLLPDEG
jgi:hypothetical protein